MTLRRTITFWPRYLVNLKPWGWA